MSEYMDDFWSLDTIKNIFSSDTPATQSGVMTPTMTPADIADYTVGIVPSVTQNLPVTSNDLSWGKVWDSLTKDELPAVLDSPGVYGSTKQYVEKVDKNGNITRVPISTGQLSGNMGLIVAVAVIGIGAIYLLRK